MHKSKIKSWYIINIKPILNILTLRSLRRSFKHFIAVTLVYAANKKNIKKLEKTFPENCVLIFQHQFFDTKGEKCYNGGAERYIQDLSDILASLNYKTVLIQIGDKKLWEKDVGSLRVIGLPANNNLEYQVLISMFSKFKFVIYSGATDWGKTLCHPNILISHGVTWDVPKRDTNVNTILKFFTQVDYFVSVDTNTISWLRSTFPATMRHKHMNYIPNYVDTMVYKPVDKNNNQVKILFPRRASPERGYWLLSEITPKVMEKYPHVAIDFIGFTNNTDILNDLKRLISLFPTRVNYGVFKPQEMVSVYQNADISLIPTEYSEGTSLSCLEAQACGNVVISTNVGGLPNLIIDGYNGLLINPDPEELLDALDRVLTSKELAEKLSQNAVCVAKEFDKTVWVKRWKQLIKLITDSNKN